MSTATGAHAFEAEVTGSGWGSSLKLDGVDVPNLVSFKIGASVEGASLELQIAPGDANKVSGFVDAVKWLGTAFIACGPSGMPLAVFGDLESAQRYLHAKGFAGGQVLDAPFEVTR